MDIILSSIRQPVNDHVYLKDPESTELGRRIVNGSIDLIYELGFEAFTFRKLAELIGSTEASVYRYFESKHKLLLYLSSWYWSWMDYKVLFSITNITEAEDRLERALLALTEEVKLDTNFLHIDEVKLYQIVIAESSKAYLTRSVDEENRYGVFTAYKNLVARVSELVLAINPTFKYPHMLISTVIEGAHLQRFFASHLPRLTDTLQGEDAVCSFYREMVFSTIQVAQDHA
ncbi:MAG: helix-turn-helix transcriptional regulator [Flavobacteriales bacterium]|nr:helix-turn-helix transcriptional regulator [Flavobacteriales bacterium]